MGFQQNAKLGIRHITVFTASGVSSGEKCKPYIDPDIRGLNI